ncbi:MAG: hypothetical protein KatS3mg127_0593 [Silanimonas sp.]|nr:MAG: hypothetical protein KatS3mg127_0593 [Silanimonas sp.]
MSDTARNLDLAAHLRAALEAIGQADEASLRAELNAILQWQEGPLVEGLARLSQQLGEALGELPAVDAAVGELPDACARLDHAVAMSEQAANRTLDLVEDSQRLMERLLVPSADHEELLKALRGNLSEMAWRRATRISPGRSSRRWPASCAGCTTSSAPWACRREGGGRRTRIRLPALARVLQGWTGRRPRSVTPTTSCPTSVCEGAPMAAVSPDIAADFLVEAGEILERLGEQLVQLEQAADDKGLLNAVFRGFHTIKGGAGFLGLTPMVDLCHALEDAFDKARDGKILLDDDAFDYAQRCLDTLSAQMAALAAGQELPPAEPELIASIKAWASGQAATKPAKPAPAARPAAGASAVAKPAAPAKAGGEAEQTVRVDTKRLDAIVNLTGELVLARNRLKVLRDRFKDEDLHRAVTALDHATARLQGSVMRTRMQPVSRVFQRFPKMARDVARQLDKQVELTLEGAETELDRNLVEALADPLVHLVRNAIDHGIEKPEVRRAAGKSPVGQVSSRRARRVTTSPSRSATTAAAWTRRSCAPRR